MSDSTAVGPRAEGALRTLGFVPRGGAGWPAGRRAFPAAGADGWSELGGPTGARLLIGPHTRPPVSTATDADGSFAAVDGEIYGDDGPIADAGALALRQVRDRGGAAAADWNAECAAAVWDARTRTLTLARDRMGVTPLYWAETPEGVLWASELRALVQAGVPRDLDPLAVDTFIATGRVPAPWTMLAAVRKVPPGHFLVVDDRGARLERHWRQTGQPRIDEPDAVVLPKLRDALAAAVARRLPTDRDLGALLSSGVDSTLLVAVATKVLGVHPRTFTFRYLEYEGPHNEDESAALRALHFGTQHERIDVDPTEIEARFEEIVGSFGEPFTYGLHTFLLERAAAGGVSALLSGVGPDGWYFSARAARTVMALRRVPLGVGLPALRAASALAGRFPQAARVERVLTHGVDGMRRNYVLTTAPERAALYTDPSQARAGEVALRSLIDATVATYEGEEPVDRDIFTEQRCFSAEHLAFWNHRWGRVHGITIRHPYLDNDFHELVVRLPRQGRDKEDIRLLAETLMPRELARSPKIFQSIPIEEWFRGPLRTLLTSRLAPERVAAGGLLRPEAVSRMVDEHLAGKGRHHWVLWALMTLVEWQETLQAPAPPAQA